ncbi:MULTISPECIES: CoA-binding protein [Flavobacterium]|uniref:CoA-binding protein n=2 Tax=Flavobacterium TaxID=237 RepID=A0AA94JR51_9FLAO|nr:MULTISPECIES: CoA-binding protein [Flavobacterium]OXA80200.1 CoA-binding protein [Flavobacterium columnare] [Flavobacterium columnare NBRC 100251 = ATCC 23463]AMA49858.1 CoA-binding protein [Flavobacterium covae]AND64612.1 CoA-binding protein [Flavobacterium covae]MCH4829068.1 CoA-binding protein [Flavobacterium columnare]MCH4833844.1 CoA-binding protein [Flavobacterium columnare]
MKTLVLGASSNPERYSFIAMSRLLQYEHEVIALGVKNERVFGIEIQKGFPLLEDIHTVTLYLNPQRQKDYYDYVIGLKPKRVIFNPGTENSEFYDLLKKNNIIIEVACTLVLLGTKQY